MKLTDKTAIVTGASRGIGPHIAKTLAQQGMTIIAVARGENGLQTTKTEIESFGGTCHMHPFDLTNVDALEGFVNDLWRQYHPIHVLVNNAGIEQYQHFDQFSKDDISSILKTNLECPLELTRSIIPKFIEQQQGHVINIASLAGKKGLAYNTVYSASKAGLLMWADGMRQEFKDSLVDISVICPGFIADTGMFYDGHIDPPALLGSSKPQKVADAVLKALRKGSCEIIVNSGPIRPLLALGQISWRLADSVMRWFGVQSLNRKRIPA
ncbi:SDR family NAD(P)-dependent oxidoreductase [Caldithrix abyssi]|nr:SDR family NAD(P)-dependent oxidoreductase [Caldithrix abyssi]